ncbi:MAG: hypothetical protein ABUT20_12600 [Bacteroidota bacterium]
MKHLAVTISFSMLFIFAFGQTPSFITDSLDSYIERGMKQWQIPGLSIAIVKDGKVIVKKVTV